VMDSSNYWVKRYSAKKYQKKKRAPKSNLENA
jgi:hypothetical protein